jgi:hypothetical protein
MYYDLFCSVWGVLSLVYAIAVLPFYPPLSAIGLASFGVYQNMAMEY